MTKRKKWYETYDEKSLLMGGLLLLIPLGAGLTFLKYAVIVGIPFLVMGVASTLLGLYLWMKKVLIREKTLQCPRCSHKQRVLKRTTAYYCESCRELILVKEARVVEEDEEESTDVREWAPYAKVMFNYHAAREYEKEGRIDEAIELYLINIEENPTSLGIDHYERAATLLEKRGRYAQAIEVCEKAMRPGAIKFDDSLRVTGLEYVEREFGRRLRRLRRKLEGSNTSL